MSKEKETREEIKQLSAKILEMNKKIDFIIDRLTYLLNRGF